MPATVGELRRILAGHGMPAEITGDAALTIQSVATLEDAVPGQISFLSNPKYEKLLTTTRASAIVLKPDAAAPPEMTLLRTADPYAAITALIVALHGYRKHRAVWSQTAPHVAPTAVIGENARVHPGAVVDENACVGKNVVLYPGAYVGPRCRLGDDVVLFPNVVLYDDTIVGNRVTIHACSVIGEDGLGYAPVGGRWIKIPQIGYVEIGDDVEIGANCSIDRATLGRTKIGSGSKFSNQIAIGHGSQIGEHCLFVAQVGIAGSVQVGHHVTMAGQAGIVGHVRIGDNSTIGAKAGVTNHVPDGETYLGQPATPISAQKRIIAAVARLPETRQTIRALERQCAEQTSRIQQLETRLAELERATRRSS